MKTKEKDRGTERIHFNVFFSLFPLGGWTGLFIMTCIQPLTSPFWVLWEHPVTSDPGDNRVRDVSQCAATRQTTGTWRAAPGKQTVYCSTGWTAATIYLSAASLSLSLSLSPFRSFSLPPHLSDINTHTHKHTSYTHSHSHRFTNVDIHRGTHGCTYSNDSMIHTHTHTHLTLHYWL